MLKHPFIDTDLLIEEQYQRHTGSHQTCREIFRLEEEMFFRELEKEVVASLAKRPESVIAIGGGTLLDHANVNVLKNLGILIFLKTETSVLLSRLKQKPSLPAYLPGDNPESAFIDLVEKRNAIYLQHADLSIETPGSSDAEVILLICQAYNGVH
jgi:shikimate kinase